MPRVLPEREKTEMYTTDDGQIVISQERWNESDPIRVFFEPQDVPIIIDWLKELSADATEIRKMAIQRVIDKEPADARPRPER
jgi:hypothetical protein